MIVSAQHAYTPRRRSAREERAICSASERLFDRLDPSTQRVTFKRLECWERAARFNEACWYYDYCARSKRISAADLCDLRQWVDYVYTQSMGAAIGTPGASVGGALYPRDFFVNDRSIFLWSHHRADINYTVESGGVSASIDQLALTPGKGYGLAQAGVTRRPIPNATGVNGRPSWDFDVADDYLEYAGTMAQDVIGGNDKAFAFWFVGSFSGFTSASFAYMWAAANNANTITRVSTFPWQFKFYASRTGDSNDPADRSSNAIVANSTPYYVEQRFWGTTVAVSVNRAALFSPEVQAQDTSNVTATKCGIHGVPRSTHVNSSGQMKGSEWIFASGPANEKVRALMDGYALRRWGV